MPIEIQERERDTHRPSAAGSDELTVTRLCKRFQGRDGEITALSNLTLSVRRHEVLGIVGPSGCGKSTLLELICGLDQPSEGALAVEGHADPDERLKRCALMFQRDLLLPWRSALDNAALAAALAGASRKQARAQALPLLERFDLAGFASAHPYELSGGMRQRIAFVRTLLTGKPVLLLDEPFGSLDSITRAGMQEWLVGALAEEPRTVVLVTHDVEEALFLCDRVVVLSKRPGSVRAEFPASAPRTLPRSHTVSSPDFAVLRQHALEALA